jgi:predicted RNA-binding protein with RPS1 domain
VHVSELSHHFITNAEEVVSVGDKIKVKVLTVDLKLKRIQLSIKALQEPPKKSEHKNKKDHKKQDQQQPVPQKAKTEDLLESLKRKWAPPSWGSRL